MSIYFIYLSIPTYLFIEYISSAYFDIFTSLLSLSPLLFFYITISIIFQKEFSLLRILTLDSALDDLSHDFYPKKFTY